MNQIFIGKNIFIEIQINFRIYADFEAYNENYNSSIVNKATNIYKQNPVFNGDHIESDLEDILRSGYNKSPLGYDNVDWFVSEVMKIEKKWLSFLKILIKILFQKKI